MKRALIGWLCALALALPAAGQDDEGIEALLARWNDPAIQEVAPFRIFDNVYYVGIEWVSAYALETSAGLILIDSLYGRWTARLIANLITLGLDPHDIRYVLCTHGHFDHHGGAAALQKRFGARVAMTENDWALAAQSENAPPPFAAPLPERDIVARDGGAIRLGDTEVKFHETPGHTTGVLSLEFRVRDGDAEHVAFTLGGAGLNFTGVPQAESYVASMERIEKFRHVQVSLPNHPAMGQVFERARRLADRAAGEPHPFVDPDGFGAWIASLRAQGQQKLALERAGIGGNPMQGLREALNPD